MLYKYFILYRISRGMYTMLQLANDVLSLRVKLNSIENIRALESELTRREGIEVTLIHFKLIED